jgi:hypothetical protein
MDLFDTLTWAEILVKTTFLGTPTLTVPSIGIFSDNPLEKTNSTSLKIINLKLRFEPCVINLIQK